ncbi:TPA: multidrug efflux RND transporter permease subunit [Campylobacter fetus subsp. venerealis]|uniref:Multidrug efflux system CmeABC, inner membrane drug transporter CmeB n=1 Tax=Campylobacter fetus subsp. venerealis NCTC 10354 TaxID=983328 RepID=A0AAE6M9R6_CAMFE|nr:multidrug efflux RND transporter permease subunit [Campylobacter fetus]OCS22542.1 RND transporter [Campylobacter fetus subsp. venerealis cfvi97/532]OCS25722.1 RND transporter [Campylobacter fetus subsp. venerealis cfvB10]OCS29937.1 RND transporter [Campylobacter fetus subsp. venerealis LMG 6570 = CCUG 33900]OCS43177.1 RND transporter [Campylobacter fetus subsp. venerealis cfvi02/298]AHE93473.1 multidrug efflux system CmeABC, inner membrane drug transporter CmeB [Campylobacter fetus subsp. v
MFSKFFINRPVFACVLSIIIVIAGYIGLKSSPIEEYPQLTPPQIMVQANYSGADAQTIADTIAAPLENAINGVQDMIYMQSTSSSAGTMSLSVYFKIGTNPQTATVNVSNRVTPALSLLPEEVKRVGVTVRERSSSILNVLSFYDPSGKMSDTEISNYININVADAIKRVPGVGDAVVIGNKDYSMRVWIKPDLLKKYSLTTTDVINSIKEQNSQYATGKIGEQPTQTSNPYVYAIKPEGRLKNVSEFENIIIKANNKGNIIKLKDVATVELGAQNYTFAGRINGATMIPMFVFLQSGANALNTADAIVKRVDELKASFPGDLTYIVGYDTTEFVKVSIDEVIKTFIEAMILVVIVMYMFLGNVRATIIPMLAVPVSILGAFGGLYAMGFSINLITLFALILAIGIVVDDAIIVIENVERILHGEPNLTVKEATIKAMSEIVAPVISIVLVLSAVFIPVSFMEGFVGVIQRQFALTLVVSVCISGLVALTLTPALCAMILRKKENPPFWFVRKFNEFFDFSTKIFTAGVAKILKHVIMSLICVGIIIFMMAELFKVVPGGLVPAEDKGSVLAITNLPPASTLSRTTEDTEFIRSIISQNPNVKNVTGLAGYDMLAGTLRENAGIMFISMIPWNERPGEANSTAAFAAQYNKQMYMADRNSMTYFMTPPPIMGLSITGGFELFAQNTEGKNYSQIEADMQKVVAKANAHPALNMVRTTLDTNFPQYDLTLDKEKIKMMGINISDVFNTLSSTIGQYYVNDFNMLGKTFKVNIRSMSEYRDSPEDLRSLYVRSQDGKMVPLDSVVSLKRSLGPDNVDRFNAFPAAKIMGEPKPGYTSGDAIKAIEQIIKEELPTGYDIGWSGSAYQEVASTGKGAQAFVFGMIFVFLILAAQYERWLMPLAVVTAVPFSVFGSLLFTWTRGLSNDVYFQIGLLLLIGLAAKNAILIVEFAMQEHLAGKSIKEAAINAARMRFRPIVMTSLAFTLGVLPMVVATGAGAASRHALGTGVIGGMIAASTIAIFFVPLFFYILESFNLWLDNKRGKITSGEEHA